MQIDKNRLFNDLNNTDRFLRSRPSVSSIMNELGRYIAQDNMFYELTGYSMDMNGLFLNPDKIQRLVYKNENRAGDDLSDFLMVNSEFIINSFNNFSEMITACGLEFYPFYNMCRNYSEKEFKEVILGFFSTFGNDVYKIAKKYIDEKRIMIGAGFYDDCSGMYLPSILNKSGYICIVPNEYDSSTLACLAHELGHAIDYEKFIYPQQKKYSVISDSLLEIPSMTYELALYDYLKKEKIDIVGSNILLNRDLNYLIECTNIFNEVYSHSEFVIDNVGNVNLGEDNIYNVRSYLIYGVATMFALYLNNINKDDCNMFKKVMRDLCTMRCELSLEECINLLGISIDEFASFDLVKHVVEDNSKSLKKKFKF